MTCFRFNDIPLIYDDKIYKKLRNANIDHLLAQHVAHLFIRDTVSLFSEKVNQDDEIDTDHFEVNTKRCIFECECSVSLIWPGWAYRDSCLSCTRVSMRCELLLKNPIWPTFVTCSRISSQQIGRLWGSNLRRRIQTSDGVLNSDLARLNSRILKTQPPYASSWC